MTLGCYDVFTLADVRKRAREALYEVAVGQDPAADKHDALHAETFAGLAKEYMERHGKFKLGRDESPRDHAPACARLVDVNPCVMIKRVVKEQARDRVLN